MCFFKLLSWGILRESVLEFSLFQLFLIPLSRTFPFFLAFHSQTLNSSSVNVVLMISSARQRPKNVRFRKGNLILARVLMSRFLPESNVESSASLFLQGDNATFPAHLGNRAAMWIVQIVCCYHSNNLSHGTVCLKQKFIVHRRHIGFLGWQQGWHMRERHVITQFHKKNTGLKWRVCGIFVNYLWIEFFFFMQKTKSEQNTTR